MYRLFPALLLLLVHVPHAVAAEYRFYHPDPLGSNVVVTDRSGNVVQRTVSDPFGETKATVNASGQSVSPSANRTRHLFTGHEQDPESGLHYMGARHYDPFVGRFLAVDPALIDPGRLIGRSFSEPSSINAYNYVYNRPTVAIDPDGKDPSVLIDIASLGLGIAATKVADTPTERFIGNMAITADVIALALPFVSFGAGAAFAAIKAARAAAITFKGRRITPVMSQATSVYRGAKISPREAREAFDQGLKSAGGTGGTRDLFEHQVQQGASSFVPTTTGRDIAEGFATHSNTSTVVFKIRNRGKGIDVNQTIGKKRAAKHELEHEHEFEEEVVFEYSIDGSDIEGFQIIPAGQTYDEGLFVANPSFKP